MNTSLGVFFWPRTLLHPVVIQLEHSKLTHTNKPFSIASHTCSACFRRESQLLGREQRAAGEIWIATSDSSQNLLSLGKPVALHDSGSCRKPESLQSWSLPVCSFWLPMCMVEETYRNAWARSPHIRAHRVINCHRFPTALVLL